MANLSPGGLIPVRMKDGSTYVGGGRPYYVPSSDSTALYIGDPVTLTGTANTADVSTGGGVATGGAGSFKAGTLPTVTRATAGDDQRITGVVVGVCYDPDDIHRPAYRKGDVEAVVMVEDRLDDVVFEVASDGALAAAQVGLNAVIIGTGGSTVTGRSNVKLDSGTATAPAVDASYQLRILGISRDLNKNDLSASGPSAYVLINRTTEDPDQVAGVA